MFLGITEYLGPSIKIFHQLLYLQSQPTHLAAVQSDVNDGNPPLTFSSFKWSFFIKLLRWDRSHFKGEGENFLWHNIYSCIGIIY